MKSDNFAKFKNFLSSNFFLIMILAMAAALRFIGLRWGLPNDLHNYSYHPDEFLTVGSSFFNIFMKGSLDPGFYNYPSLYLYISALFSAVGVGYGVKPTPENIYLFARVATVVMGVCSVWATYWAGCKLFNKNSGLIAASILAILPIHVQHSHFATVDVPCTLFIALTLGFCGLIINRGLLKDYIFAGLMCGLATGTKYNAALVFLSIIAASIIARIQKKNSDNEKQDSSKPISSSKKQTQGNDSKKQISSNSLSSKAMSFPRKRESRKPINVNNNVKFFSSGFLKIASAFIFTIIGFVLSTPGSVLYTSEFLHGIQYEMIHTSTGHGLVFLGTGNGLVFNFTHNLWHGIGPFFAILFLGAAIYSIIKKDKIAIIILAFAIPYYVLISLSQVRFARYIIPMLPGIALICSFPLPFLIDGLSENQKLLKSISAIISSIVLIGVMMATIFTSISILKLDLLFIKQDVRDQAARWVFANVKKGDSIGLVDAPWFYSPPLSKMFGYGTLDSRIEQANQTPYKIDIISTGYDWKKNPPKWVILTDFETEDAIRLRNKEINSPEMKNINRINQFLDFVEANYRKRMVFANGASNLPHDMKYTAPTIEIYEVRK